MNDEGWHSLLGPVGGNGDGSMPEKKSDRLIVVMKPVNASGAVGSMKFEA